MAATLRAYCKTRSVERLQQVQPVIIREHMRILTQEQKSEGSVKRTLVAIRMFLRFAKITGLIEDDFSGILEGPKLWQRLPTVCSKEQRQQGASDPYRQSRRRRDGRISDETPARTE